jgi:ABC-type nickel/cobalt efflux system permease component RcnA
MRVLVASSILLAAMAGSALAHPLGNFTINHFSHIEIGSDRIHIRYVLDMAEIPAFRELKLIDTDHDGTPSKEEMAGYLEKVVGQLSSGLSLSVDGSPVPLEIVSSNISTPAGAGGLATLRVECGFSGAVDGGSGRAHHLRFENINHRDLIGWREVVVSPAQGVAIFDSSAFGNGISDELRAYPEDLLAAPLDEATAELSFIKGTAPAGSKPLMTREGRVAQGSRDRFAELISVPSLTPGVALLGLLIAAALGSVHALSPGHGKTVVGAYLVGTRGTARHAAFLGLTVTITHTIGVFALGLITLFASQYIVPERLFPVLNLASGAIVLVIGLSLFTRRLRAALVHQRHDHAHHYHGHDHVHHGHDHHHGHSHKHSHDGHDHVHHDHDHSHHSHSHGGREHSHLPPGADGSPVTWKGLLALGISGGLLPCPSALVVLLSAISLNRVGYGLVLVIAFSVGLAATLTAVGLLFVYAGRLIKGSRISGRLARTLPVVSALVITCAGLVICYEALVQAGVKLVRLF